MILLKVLYPERRMVTEAQVLTWASDSYYNNADFHRCVTCGDHALAENGCEHETTVPEYNVPTPKPETLEDAMAWLEDRGEVTFARRDP